MRRQVESVPVDMSDLGLLHLDIIPPLRVGLREVHALPGAPFGTRGCKPAVSRASRHELPERLLRPVLGQHVEPGANAQPHRLPAERLTGLGQLALRVAADLRQVQLASVLVDQLIDVIDVDLLGLVLDVSLRCVL